MVYQPDTVPPIREAEIILARDPGFRHPSGVCHSGVIVSQALRGKDVAIKTSSSEGPEIGPRSSLRDRPFSLIDNLIKKLSKEISSPNIELSKISEIRRNVLLRFANIKIFDFA